MIKKQEITVNINGVDRNLEVEPRKLLSDFLREDFGLTGTHVSCEIGVCGVCTVLLNDKTCRSCLTFAIQANGAEVKTVEYFNQAKGLNYIQKAFHKNHALQCGYCTPGFLIVLDYLFTNNKNPTDDQINEALSDVLCRCTGYKNIFKAACDARDALKKYSNGEN
tara:strand:+ start:431 stop:925 length:495 start_codon:yes stop_codon:yes gene_type:complete